MSRIIMVEKKNLTHHKSFDIEQVEKLRHDYSIKKLCKGDVDEDPIRQFERWFEEALTANLPDANAMTLATATPEGKPSARSVLLKGFDEAGFRFYTNYQSRKAKELAVNPNAALCFLWSGLERQVRIEGKVEKLSKEKSAEYFKKRPRQSQLGAWASHQSSEISSRKQLEQQFEKITQKFKNKAVPVPHFWGGYLLRPSAIEFWQGRPGRLHDRILYSKDEKGNSWLISRLCP